MGRSGASRRQDEGRPRRRRRSPAGGGGPARHRTRRGPLRGRERRPLARGGARAGRSVRPARRRVVRGAGLLRRPAGTPRLAPTAPGRHGDRGGRVRLPARVLPPHARGRRGRCDPGRRDALRRRHRVHGRGGARRRVRGAAVEPLRARPARGPLLRGRTRGAPRMVPRPRAHRGDALRRRAAAPRRKARARSLAAGTRARLQAKEARCWRRPSSAT